MTLMFTFSQGHPTAPKQLAATTQVVRASNGKMAMDLSNKAKQGCGSCGGSRS